MAGDCDRAMGPVRVRTKDMGRSRIVQIGLKPLALNALEAAALCGLSQSLFLKEVAAGNLPAPVRLTGKRKVWSLRALESAINGHDGGRTAAANTDPLMREIKSRVALQLA
jgi:predicted DNA-binding transcriptional regulator AlpA